MKLSIEERAQLAGQLLLSIDEPTESEVEGLWIDEAERRLQEFRDGKKLRVFLQTKCFVALLQTYREFRISSRG